MFLFCLEFWLLFGSSSFTVNFLLHQLIFIWTPVWISLGSTAAPTATVPQKDTKKWPGADQQKKKNQ